MTPSDRLSRAAAEGNVAELRRLLDGGSDPNGLNVYGRSAIQVMKLGNPKVAELLLERKANPNVPDPSTGSLPVHDAAREGFLDTLQVLISGGARLDLPNYYGRLPLDEAAENGQNRVVQFLARRQRDNA
ncbi:cyclin-dependent kinase inhibitor 2A-like [Pantherophis guttatus]|uniref:Cyclin-dependent kinase inhibitor 2A-like n=1 Tax=Pantherophis guttatus TaxID=94885 RepID=A0A6P9B7C3_PANGU|nr:cyclin-dependent kinase inhibitor 2A-like [Pantherophis guttatus]